MRFFIWIDTDGKPVSRAWPYEDEYQLSAEQESMPSGAFALRAGTEDELKSMYGLEDEDFEHA